MSKLSGICLSIFPVLFMIAAVSVVMNGSRPQDSEVNPSSLRIISYNIRYFEPPARTDESKVRVEKVQNHKQVVKRLALELKLYEPDILTLQEATPKESVARLADELDMNWVFFEGSWGDEYWPHGYPGAILTRFEIIESQNRPLVNYDTCPEDMFTRHFGRAVVDTNMGELVLLSAHLLPGNRETSEDVHRREISEILAVADKDRKAGRSVILIGDLNHRPDGFEYKMWKDSGLTDAFIAKGPGESSPPSYLPPRRRIDYIWAAGPIVEKLDSCRFLNEGAFRTNPEDPGSFSLSDHLPVLAVFKEDKR